MQWVTARSYSSEAAAALAIASLETASVPAELRSSVPAIGWPDFRIMVPTEYLDQATTILATPNAPQRPLLDVHAPPPRPEAIGETRRKLHNCRGKMGIAGALLLLGTAGVALGKVSVAIGALLAGVGLIFGLFALGRLNHIQCPRCRGYVIDPFSPWDRWFSATCSRCGFSLRSR
jgi:hypothetical protein